MDERPPIPRPREAHAPPVSNPGAIFSDDLSRRSEHRRGRSAMTAPVHMQAGVPASRAARSGTPTLYATQKKCCTSNFSKRCANSQFTEEDALRRKEMTWSSIVRDALNKQRRATRKSRQNWSFPRDLEPLLYRIQPKSYRQSCSQLRNMHFGCCKRGVSLRVAFTRRRRSMPAHFVKS